MTFEEFIEDIEFKTETDKTTLKWIFDRDAKHDKSAASTIPFKRTNTSMSYMAELAFHLTRKRQTCLIIDQVAKHSWGLDSGDEGPGNVFWNIVDEKFIDIDPGEMSLMSKRIYFSGLQDALTLRPKDVIFFYRGHTSTAVVRNDVPTELEHLSTMFFNISHLG